MNFRFEDKYLTDLGLSITIAKKLQDEILSGFNSVLYVILSLTQYGVIGLQTPYYVLSIEHESEMSLAWVFKSGWSSSSDTMGIIDPPGWNRIS